MIIVDLNQVMISNLMAQIGNHTNIELDEGLLRHMILNSLRANRAKFKDYGEMIIACDDKNYWRKDIFPYYKAARKTQRQQSELDWNAIFGSLNKVRDELKEFFPYRVIQAEKAEADDVIATLCKEFGSEGLASGEKILILSGDKDFVQLQKYANVDQYSPVLKKHIRHNNPQQYIIEHVIRGDRTDGIPNILSPDDVFVHNSRQKPLTKKKIEEITNEINAGNSLQFESWYRNYQRNQQLVDLSFIPDYIREDVIKQYNEQSKKDRSKLFNYFINYNLKNLVESIGDF